MGFREHGKNQEFCFGYVKFEMPIRSPCGHAKEKVSLWSSNLASCASSLRLDNSQGSANNDFRA